MFFYYLKTLEKKNLTRQLNYYLFFIPDHSFSKTVSLSNQNGLQNHSFLAISTIKAEETLLL